jgi:hypothetical protein
VVDITKIKTCPSACHETRFITDSSTTSISPYVIKTLIEGLKNDTKLGETYKNAKELRRKVDPIVNFGDRRRIQKLHNKYLILRKKINFAVRLIIGQMKAVLTSLATVRSLRQNAADATAADERRFSFDTRRPLLQAYLQPQILAMKFVLRDMITKKVAMFKRLRKKKWYRVLKARVSRTCNTLARFETSYKVVNRITNRTLGLYPKFISKGSTRRYTLLSWILGSDKDFKNMLVMLLPASAALVDKLAETEDACTNVTKSVKSPEKDFQTRLATFRKKCKEMNKLNIKLSNQIDALLSQYANFINILNQNLQSLNRRSVSLVSYTRVIHSGLRMTSNYLNRSYPIVTTTKQAFAYSRQWHKHNQTTLAEIFYRNRGTILYFPYTLRRIAQIVEDSTTKIDHYSEAYENVMTSLQQGHFRCLPPNTRVLSTIARTAKLSLELYNEYFDEYKTVYYELMVYRKSLIVGPAFIR